MRRSLRRGGWSRGVGLGELWTTDGHRVNRLDKGHYEIIGWTDVEVWSDDPNAP
jgi:hypothetical protein